MRRVIMAEGKAKTKPKGMKKIRLVKKAKKTFYVPNSLGKHRMKSVKPRWRRPRGVDNKKRIRKEFFGQAPRIGNKNSLEARGKHPLGFAEVRVFTPAELEGLKDVVIRIGGSVGKRKRAEIAAKAKALNLRVLNERNNGVAQ